MNYERSLKAKITINNYLGGQYFFTVDEIKLTKEKLFLIEGKHSANAMLPSKGDIKDGLLKMILYCNLSNTKVNEKKINSEPILELTSVKLQGAIKSDSTSKEIEIFLEKNNFSGVHKKLVTTLIGEAKRNKFTVSIKEVK